jgi:hypothetical protein
LYREVHSGSRVSNISAVRQQRAFACQSAAIDQCTVERSSARMKERPQCKASSRRAAHSNQSQLMHVFDAL